MCARVVYVDVFGSLAICDLCGGFVLGVLRVYIHVVQMCIIYVGYMSMIWGMYTCAGMTFQ